MLKRYSILAAMSIFLLCGCSEGSIKENSEINSMVKASNAESHKSLFHIETIDSKIIDLNDAASSESIKGVRYEIMLFSKDQILPEEYSSYEFEIVSNSNLKELLGSSENLSLAKTLDDGYLYSVSFETIYEEYTLEELEVLKKERDFQLFVNFEGLRHSIEF